jgi:hypothetical protein
MLKCNPLSQRDERWKLKRLGFGSGTIGSYGCLLTCYTIILNYFTNKNFTPDQVNEAMKAIGGYTGETKNLWMWYKPDEIYPTKFTVNSPSAYDDSAVKNWISKGIPVIIKVNGAPIGGDMHFVVAIGDGKIIDVWDGQIKPFSSYTPIGYHVYTYTGEEVTNSQGETMDNALKSCMADREKFWKERDKLGKELEEANNTIKAKDILIKKLEDEAVKSNAKIANLSVPAMYWEDVKKAYGVASFTELDAIIRGYKEELAGIQPGTCEPQVPETETETSYTCTQGCVKIESLSAKELIRLLLKKVEKWFIESN